MGPATTVLASSASSTITSVTPVNIFAFIFEILVFILVVLSIVTLVRRYLGVRSQAQAQAQAETTLILDVEAQTTQGDSVKNISRFGRLSSLFGWPRSKGRDDSLDDTDALLAKDTTRSLDVSVLSGRRLTTCKSASISSVFCRLRTFCFIVTGVKSTVPSGSSPSDLESGLLCGPRAHATIQCAHTDTTDNTRSLLSSKDASSTTDLHEKLHRQVPTIKDHPIPE